MKVPINVPEGARFTCQSCGRCCKGWAVHVDQATVDRLRIHDWGGDPFEALPPGGPAYRIRLVGGSCFFLDGENRCRIHSEISYAAKPPVCRAFPVSVLEVGGRLHARLSFWCPTVVANAGRPLEQQVVWLKDSAKLAGRRTAPLTVDGVREIDSRAFERIHGVIRRCVLHPGLPIRDRLAAGAGVVRRLHATEGEAVDFGAIAEAAAAQGMLALAREAAQGGQASAGRRLLMLYLLLDGKTGTGHWSMLRRLVSIVLFNAGVWALYSRAMDARASWRAIRRAAFSSSAASDELLSRYFASKLDSRRYVSGGASLVTGFNELLAAYAIVEVLARTLAADGGRVACTDDDLREAVGAADLLVVEHLSLDPKSIHRRLIDAALENPDLWAGLQTSLSGGFARLP